MLPDFRANKPIDGYTLFGGIRFRLDALLSTDGGRLTADDAPTLALCDASAAGEFTWRPGKHVWVLTRLLVVIEAQGVLDPSKYGGAELSTGFKVTMKNNSGAVLHRFNPKPIVRIADWALIAGQDPSPDKKLLHIRWTLAKGGPLNVLDANVGQYFSVDQPEAPSGIMGQFYLIQGFQLTPYSGELT